MNNRSRNAHARTFPYLMVLFLTTWLLSSVVFAGEFGVVTAKPNKLFVVNLDSSTINKECTYP